MRTSVQRITPDMAKIMLGSNTKNRALRRHRILQYADQMTRGQWQLTGEPIKFAHDGTLIDGQHRLHAIVESGMTIEMLIVHDLDLSTFKVIDSGMSRRPSDALKLMGVNNSNQKAAMVRAYIAADAGINLDNTQHMTRLITRTDISDFVVANDKLVTEAMTAARHVMNNCRGNSPAWGSLYMLITKKHGQAVAESFFRSIAEGAGLAEGDPRLAVRNWAVRNSNNKSRSDHLAAYVRAWNAYVSNEKILLLRLPNTIDPDKAFNIL